MFLVNSTLKQASAGLEVQLPAIGDFYNLRSGAVCYSGIRFGSDGVIYRATNTGAWQSTGSSWLLGGSAADYYLVRTNNGPNSLLTDDGTLQQMNANLDYTILTTTGGQTKQAELDFAISDDSGGTPELVTQSYTLEAERL